MNEAGVLQSQGMSIEVVARTLEIASQTYYRWGKEYWEFLNLPFHPYNLLRICLLVLYSIS